MREITLHVSESVPDDVLAARAVQFPGPSTAKCVSDAFDERSIHLMIWEASQLAAYGRLTLGPPGVFRTWSHGAAQIPEGRDVADLGRCFVQPDYRRLELLRLMCLEGLTYALTCSMRVVNGAYIPGRFLAGTLHELGFCDSGTPVDEFEPNGCRVTIQPVTCDLRASANRWSAQRALCLQHLAKCGFAFDDASQMDRWSA
jgi:hypothetical protein